MKDEAAEERQKMKEAEGRRVRGERGGDKKTKGSRRER